MKFFYKKKRHFVRGIYTLHGALSSFAITTSPIANGLIAVVHFPLTHS